ncbi:hypothetical protein [Streptomyces sp. NPDC002851]
MPKLLPAEYVLAKPKPPSWWKRNRHVVTLVAGLVIGAWLVSDHDSTAPSTPGHPAPTPTASHAGVDP